MKSYTPIKCEHRGIRFEVTADREHAYWRIEDGPFRRTTFVGQTTGETLMREAIREAREYIDKRLDGLREADASSRPAGDPTSPAISELTNPQLSACHPEQVCWLYETAYSTEWPPRDPERREAPLIETAEATG